MMPGTIRFGNSGTGEGGSGVVVGTVVGPVVGSEVGPVVGNVVGTVVGTVVSTEVGSVVGTVFGGKDLGFGGFTSGIPEPEVAER